MHYGFDNLITAAVNCVFLEEPRNYQEVLFLESTEQRAWLKAMQAEFDLLSANKVFSLAELPKDKHLVSCRWLYKVKQLPDGKIQRKAR